MAIRARNVFSVHISQFSLLFQSCDEKEATQDFSFFRGRHFGEKVKLNFAKIATFHGVQSNCLHFTRYIQQLGESKFSAVAVSARYFDCSASILHNKSQVDVIFRG